MSRLRKKKLLHIFYNKMFIDFLLYFKVLFTNILFLAR